MTPSAQAPRRTASWASARFVLPQILTRIYLGSQKCQRAHGTCRSPALAGSGKLLLAGAVFVADQLAEQRFRILGSHQRRADQHRVDTDALQLLELLSARDAALSYDGLA